MKHLLLAVLSALTLISTAAAGPLVARALVAHPVGPLAVAHSALYRDQEWYFDGYGSYLKHYESDYDHDGDHDGIGGGFAIGYYFSYYAGARFDVNFSSVDDAETAVAGDLLVRFPIADTHLAPYAFAGGGLVNNSDSRNGFFRAGGGLEYRFTQHFGIFVEGSYAWVDEKNDGDNLTAKVGVRLIY